MFENHNPTIHITYLQETLINFFRLLESHNPAKHITYFQETLIFFSPLVWKPQSSYPHSLFARNLNIFLLHLSLNVHWRLSKICSFVFHLITIPQACVLSCHHSLSLCFISLPPSELVFHRLMISWLCVSSPLKQHCNYVCSCQWLLRLWSWTSLVWSSNVSQRRKFIE